jgi:hypothetical protein
MAVTLELVRCESNPHLKSGGGTQYYRFSPNDRGSSGIFFELFDRFVVTWVFTIFDIMLVPVIVWAALMVAASVLVPFSRLVAASVRLTPRWILWLLHTFAHWLGLLGISLLHYLHWIRHI